MTDPLLEVKDLHVGLPAGGGRMYPILQGVSFKIMPGEVTPTLFVGLGGSGGQAVGRIARRLRSSEDYTLKVAGYEIDLEPLVQKQSERFAEWVANNIADNVFQGFRGIKNVILVGGGALLVEDHLRQIRPYAIGQSFANEDLHDLERRHRVPARDCAR